MAQSEAFLRMQKVVFVVSYINYGSFYFARKPFSVVKKAMSTDLGFTTAELGQIDTAFLVLYAAGQFVLPQLGDRIGARRMLIGITGVVAVTVWMFAYCTTLHGFMFWYGLNGFLQSAGFPLCMKALAPWFSSESRGKVLGLWTTSQQIGGVLSTSFAGYMIAKYGWEFVFTCSAVPLFVGTVTWVLIAESPDELAGRSIKPTGSPLLGSPTSGARRQGPPKTPTAAPSSSRRQLPPKTPDVEGRTPLKRRSSPGKELVSDSSEEVFSSSAAAKLSYAEVLMIPGLLPCGASYFCIKLVRYTLMFWLPFFLAEEHGFGAAEAAYFSTLFDIGGVAGSLLCGFLSDNIFSGQRVLVSGMMSMATGMFLILYGSVSSADQLTNAFFLFTIGLCIAGPDSVLGGAATQDVCERAGAADDVLSTACGITNGVGSLGSMLQGPLSAFLVGRYGWSGLFVSLGAMCCTGVIFIVPTMFRMRTPPKERKRAHKNSERS